METGKNIHKGHRERMIERLLTSPNGLLEHELLEILLYSFIPRINTNPIAHDLINVFGSIDGVFSATPQELSSVPGIGKKTSANIALLGLLMNSIIANRRSNKKINFLNVREVIDDKEEHFANLKEEKFLVILLDEKRKEIITLNFTDKEKDKVTINVSLMISAFGIHKPSNVILLHNHPSGDVNPSGLDDFSTQKANLVCTLSGVNLLDHIIIHKEKYFSYHGSGRMDFIKSTSDLEKLIDLIKE